MLCFFSVTNCASIDKQDKKRHGPLYDVDPTEQYEIDRSELEPLDHIPPLYKVISFLYICFEKEQRKVAPS